MFKEQCHSLFRQKGPILTNTYICIYFSNKDHSVGGMWPRNSIALDSMDSYWGVFVASFFFSLLCALLLFAVVFLYRRRVEVYPANLNVQHTATLKQIIGKKNGTIPKCDVCSICLVRLFKSCAHIYL